MEMEDSAGSWSCPGRESSCPMVWAGKREDGCIDTYRKGLFGKKAGSSASVSDADPKW